MKKDLDKTLPELADPPKYCIPSKNGGFIKEYEEGLQHIVDTWKKMRSELKKILTTSERDLISKRPILSPEKFVYCTRTMEGAMTPDELSEFNKMMFNHYQNVLINGGDEVNADIRQLCQEGMARHQPQW